MVEISSRQPLAEGSDPRLFVDWMWKLVDRFATIQQTSSGGDTWQANLEAGGQISVIVRADRTLSVSGPDHLQTDLQAILPIAIKNTQELNYGEGAWYTIDFSTDVTTNQAAMSLHFMRHLMEYKRYQGPWKVSNDVLVELDHEVKGTIPGGIPNPKFTVKVTLKAPTPAHGPFGQFVGEQMATQIRAIVAFASGTALQHSGPLWAADAEAGSTAQARLAGVQELFVEDLPLWPSMMALTAGGTEVEALRRLQRALFAYEQALDQESEFVTAVMLVSAMEALGAPNTGWDRERLTKRFIEVVKQASPDGLAQVLAHGNFQAAFGRSSSPNSFLSSLYNRRSKPLHTGFLQHSVWTISGFGGDATQRVALTSMLTRAVILGFLRRPFTSLLGHPTVDPVMLAAAQSATPTQPP